MAIMMDRILAKGWEPNGYEQKNGFRLYLYKNMLVRVEFKVEEPQFRRLLLKNFPEVYEEIEADKGLIHLEMGALERLANSCINSGDMKFLKRIYGFVSDLCKDEKKLDPNILNAIHVSFLEGLNLADDKFGDSAKKLLPPTLLKMWNAQMDHNRKIGWFR